VVDEYSWDQVLEAGLFVPGGVSSLRLANLSIYVAALLPDLGPLGLRLFGVRLSSPILGR